MSLLKGIAIDKIIVEATSNGQTVLVTRGALKPGQGAINADSYNNVELPNAVYEGDDVNFSTEHLSIDLLNSNNSNYKITALNKATVKPFIFSALPFEKPADVITFKIVTSEGAVFARTYNASDDEEKDIVAMINGTYDYDGDNQADENGAAFEGGQVDLTVTIDELVEEEVIYTEEQFEAEWNKAMSSTKDYELVIGEDLELNRALTFNQVNKRTVTVSAHCDEHSVTIKGLSASKGILNFETPLVVDGDVTSTNAELNITDLSAENIEVSGTATINVRSAKKLYVGPSGYVTLSKASRDIYKTIEKIEVDATMKAGQLFINNFEIVDLTSEGEVEVGENVASYGTVTNKNYFALAADFSNEGVFNQEGEVVTGDNLFNNMPGATLNLKVAEKGANYVNSAKTAVKGCGVINVEMPDAGENVEGKRVQFGASAVNNGIVNIKKGYVRLGESDETFHKTDSEGIINVSKGATLGSADNDAIEGGRVYLLSHLATVSSRIESVHKYYQVNGQTTSAEWAALQSGDLAYSEVANLVITGAVTVNDDAKANAVANHDIWLESTLTLGQDVNLWGSLIVSGNGTVKSNSNTEVRNLGLFGTGNKINSGASLTIVKVNLKATRTDATLNQFGSFNKSNGTVDSSVTVAVN